MKASRFSRMAAMLLPLCLVTASHAAETKTPLSLPFAESFATSTLGPAWSEHVSKGNTIAVKEGALAISAQTNTYAHIERPLEVDFVRVSCAIKPAPAITWCTSLFVYWDPGNWCQMGINSRDGGRYYVLEMTDQKPKEYELGKCAFDSWNQVAVELGADCIRYLSSTDGREFKSEAVHRRPEQYNRRPRLLIVGKGHGGPPAYPAADLNNDYQEPGEMGTSLVRDLRVSALDWARLQATADELAAWEAEGRDLPGEAELAAKNDPTFESLCKYFPEMKYPREVVGVKDHPQDIGVAWDGALQLNSACYDGKQPIAFFEVGDPPYRFGSGKAPCKKRLLNGYMPIVIATDQHDGLELEQTVFGYTKGLSPDEPLFGYVRLKMANPAAESKKLKLRFRPQPASDKCPPKDWQIDIPAGGQQTVALSVPFAVAEKPTADVSSDEFDRKLAEVTGYWAKLIDPGTRFEIPEQRVQDAYRAWLAYNFLNVDKRDGVYHVCDGAGFYEEVYGYSAALYCHMLDLMGYHEIARTYLESLLTFQQPDGLICVNFGDTDTGTTLYVMSEHYRFTRDADWLRRVAPKMIAMCDWIIRHRPESMKPSHDGRTAVWGLIRYRPYCDHQLPAFDYYSNGYLCMGMKAASEVFAEIGMSEQAARLSKEAEAYRKDLLTSMDAAVITRDGMKMLPIMPDTHELLREAKYTANGYYGLVASCVLETGIPAHDDPRSDWIVDMLRRKSGLLCGVAHFRDMIDHAYAYGYWMTCLKRDEVKRVILGLYGSMAYGMSRDTYAAVECHRITTGENYWTLPHTYSNTKQVRILRNMLLREDGGDLLLGYAVPRPWLADGKRVAVKQAPTLFGPVSYAIDSHAADGRIHVRIEPPKRGEHKMVRIRLRHPEGTNIKDVECKPDIRTVIQDDVIEFPSLKEAVNVTVKY